jgi:uncharacterized protein (TIRG00374 family)
MKSGSRIFHSLLWLLPVPLILLAVLNTSLAEVAAKLADLTPWQFLALAAVNTGIFLLLTGRWWLILRAQGSKVSFVSLAAYRLAGFGLAYLSPGPQMGGEPLQVHLVRSRHGVPTSTSVASVTLDKLLELQSNFAFLVLGLVIILRGNLLGDHLGPAALLFVLGLLALPVGYLCLLKRDLRPLSGLARRLSMLAPSRPLFSRVHEGFVAAEAQVSQFLRKRPLALLAALLLSLLIWISMLVEFLLTLRFLGIHLDLAGAIVLLTSARIAFLLPIPAGAGSLEAALILAARALGIHPALAISLSLLIRLRDLSLAGLGLSLGAALTRTHPVKPLPAPGSD